MFCQNHPDREATSACSHCQAILCDLCLPGSKEHRPVCVKCRAQLAAAETASGVEQDRADAALRDQEGKRAGKVKRRLVVALAAAVITAAVAVIALQLPELKASLKPAQPMRIGTYDTDSRTDACIDVVWKAVSLLQQGHELKADLTCPDSSVPLRVERTRDDIFIRVADPERYGFSAIVASIKHPMPEVIR